MINRFIFVRCFIILSYPHFSTQGVAPLLNAPFNATSTFRNNFCKQQLQVLDGNVDLSDSLRGENLSIYTIQEQPVYMSNLHKNKTINDQKPGFMIEILDEVARRSGFYWRNSYSAYTLNETGLKTYSNLLLWSVRNYDVSAYFWDKTAPRMAEGVVFPQNYHDESIVMVTLKNNDNDAISYTSFTNPFTPSVWLAILGTVLFSGLTYFFVSRIESKTSQDEAGENQNSFGSSFYLAAMAFTGNIEMEASAFGTKLLSFSLAFWALLITAAYTANLASFLLIKNSSLPINSMEQAVRKQVPICVVGFTNHDEYVSAKYPEARLRRKNNRKEMFDDLLNGHCSVLLIGKKNYEVETQKKEHNANCRLTTVGSALSDIPAGFANTHDAGDLCTSLVYHVLDYHLMNMQADGFIDDTWGKYLNMFDQPECKKSEFDIDIDAPESSLGLNEMAGIFILHLIISSVAIIVPSIKYVMQKYCVKQKLDPMEDSRNVDDSELAQSTDSDTRLRSRRAFIP